MERSASFPYSSAMWTLTAVFAVRVAGQAVQHWRPLPFLPPFEGWQGSDTPYAVLLLLQLLILGLMARTSWRVSRRVAVPSRRLARWLAWLGGIYMAGSLLRIAIGLAVPTAPAWFSAWISAGFHVALAAFVLVAARYHLQPAGRMPPEARP